jgi:hypothetical protein
MRHDAIRWMWGGTDTVARSKTGVGSKRGGLHSCVGQARLTNFSFIPRVFKYSNTFQVVKYDKGNSRGPKISKHFTGVDLILMNNFSHWPNFILPLDFMLYVLEQDSHLNLP